MLRIADIRAAFGRQLLAERPGSARSYAGVANDSRKARPGDLFFALATENRDGHEFVAAAVAAGCTGVVVEREVEVPQGIAAFRVRSSQTALGNLAAYWRRRFSVRAIVVTGSVGKTTTKELVAAVLASGHRVLKSPANFNDEVGVSMTLMQLQSAHERAVLEVGMFAPGEIRRLCEIARPEVGVVMNVGPSHLERLKTREAIARAKAEAVESLPWSGTAVLNADDPAVAAMRDLTRARVLTFGLKPGADVRATEVQSRGLDGVDFHVTMAGRGLNAHSPLPGAALVLNALAAIVVAVSDGMALEEAVDALRGAQVPARLQPRRTRGGALVLDDTYNASPASVLAALSVLEETPGRHLALLGDMLELGPAEDEGHRLVGEHAAAIAEVLFTVGPRASRIAESARLAGARCVAHFQSKEAAARALERELRAGDVLLVKASHGMALEHVVAELTR